MAKHPASPTRIYLDEFDFSGSLTSTSLDITQEILVATCLADAGPRRLVGNYDYAQSHSGFFESTDDGFDEQVFLLLSDAADHYLTQLFGANVEGSIAYDSVVRLSGQPRSAAVGGAVLLNFDTQGSGGLARGLVLGHKTTTGAENLTGYNQGPVLLTEYDETNQDTDHLVGDDAARTQRGQGLKVSDDKIGEIRLWLKKIDLPTDDLIAEIRVDDAGKPSTTAVVGGVSTAVDGATLAVGYGWIRFIFPQHPVLVKGTQYHVILRRSTAPDAVKHYAWGDDSSGPTYGDGEASIFDGATWAADAGNDLCFEVYNWRGSTYAVIFRVLAFTGTDITINVEEADASGGAYTAIAGVTSGALNAIGCIRATSVATLKDWRRVAITGTYTTALILVTAGVVQEG